MSDQEQRPQFTEERRQKVADYVEEILMFVERQHELLDRQEIMLFAIGDEMERVDATT